MKPAPSKSWKDGIDFCKARLIGVTEDSPNGLKELQSYSYMTDKFGKTIDAPVKFMDHFCDAGRYGSYLPDRFIKPAGTIVQNEDDDWYRTEDDFIAGAEEGDLLE